MMRPIITIVKPACGSFSSIGSQSRMVWASKPSTSRLFPVGWKSIICRNSTGTSNVRSYPSYTVFGEKCILNLKLQPPHFRVSNNNVLQLDSSKKGRLMLEWVPRNADGTVSRYDQLRFSLSAEESGLLIDQIPKTDVELFRIPSNSPGGNSENAPEKILRVIPDISGQVLFRIEYTSKNGGDGGLSSNNIEAAPTPLEVKVQLGEYQVMKQIILSSLPTLVGWTTMMEVAVRQNENDALNSSSYTYGQDQNNYRSTGKRYDEGNSRGSLPF